MKTWGYFGNADVQGEVSEQLMDTGNELFLFLDVTATNPGHIVAWNFYTFTVRWVGGRMGVNVDGWVYGWTVGARVGGQMSG